MKYLVAEAAMIMEQDWKEKFITIHQFWHKSLADVIVPLPFLTDSVTEDQWILMTL